MKKTALILICVFACMFSYGQSTFQYSYGAKGINSAPSFTQTYDNGFALWGSLSTGYYYLVKIDSSGHKKWSKIYSYSYGPAQPVGIIQTKDSGFLVSDNYDVFKLDSVGNVQWARNYGYSYKYVSKLMQVNGGYIIADGGGSLFFKIDNSGNILWTSNSLSSDEYVYDMVQLPYDSCFYVLSRSSLGAISKFDKNGVGIWNKQLYISGGDYGTANTISVDPNGKDLDAFLCDGDYTNVWFSFDTNGTVKKRWAIEHKGNGYPYSMLSLHPNSNSLIFALNNYEYNIDTSAYNFLYHIALFKADSTGKIVWSRKIGGPKTDYFYDLQILKNNSIGIFGTTESYTPWPSLPFGENTYPLYYFVKTDSTGLSSCNTDTVNLYNLNTVSVQLVDTPSYSFAAGTIASDSLISIGVSNITDTDFNDCLCYPPHAGFKYEQVFGIIADSSSWATKWFWSFGDGTYVSTDVYPIHRYADTGKYTVCLKVTNACGADSVCQVIDYQYPTVGIQTVTSNPIKIILYPNPNNGAFTIKEEGINNGGQEIEVYNVMGQKVASSNSSQGGAVKSLPLGGEGWAVDLVGQPNGIYFYRVISDKGELLGSGKVVVEK